MPSGLGTACETNRSKVNSLRKAVESKRQRILELNSVKECLNELQEKYVCGLQALPLRGHLQRARSVARHHK